MSADLTAGVGRIDITPPVGFRMMGAMLRTEGSIGIESALLATTLVLAVEGEGKVVLVDCDLIGFDIPLSDTIRQAIAERVGTSSSCVIIGCTHTHNGPCTVRGSLGGVHDVPIGDPAEPARLDAYIENLVGQLAGIAAQADSLRTPARIGGGRGEASVAINREEVADDGRVLVGRNPDGTTDHSVDVLRVDDTRGNPIAALVGYAAHPVVMGYNTYHLSQDYPGVVRRIVESATGATCLFFTGAAGNQALLSFLQDDWGEKERTGGTVAGAAVKAFFEIETRPHEVVRTVGASLASVAFYEKQFRQGPTHTIFATASREVTVPLQPFPSLAEAEAVLTESQATVSRLLGEGAPTVETYPAQLVVRWAQGVFDKIKAGVTCEEITFEIVGVRVDDIALVAMPGEPFVEIGLGVKERSQARHTLFAGYCNGVIAYWPTAETVAQGGMSVDAAIKSYNIPTPPAAETVDIIVAAFADLLADLEL